MATAAGIDGSVAVRAVVRPRPFMAFTAKRRAGVFGKSVYLFKLAAFRADGPEISKVTANGVKAHQAQCPAILGAQGHWPHSFAPEASFMARFVLFHFFLLIRYGWLFVCSTILMIFSITSFSAVTKSLSLMDIFTLSLMPSGLNGFTSAGASSPRFTETMPFTA